MIEKYYISKHKLTAIKLFTALKDVYLFIFDLNFNNLKLRKKYLNFKFEFSFFITESNFFNYFTFIFTVFNLFPRPYTLLVY